MKINRNITTLLFILVLFSVLATGCRKDTLGSDNGEIVEGVKTVMKLNIIPPKMEIETRGTLPPDKEKEVISLAVFTFDQSGMIISSAMHETVVAHVTGGSLGIDPGASMEIPAISGPGRQIYAIANYDANHIENLKSVASLSDLKQLIFDLYANPILREFGMTKVGNTTVDIPANGTAVSVELRFVSAKVTIKVINKSPDLVVDSWNVGNVPLKSFLIERPYNSSNPNMNDAVDHNNENDFYNDFSYLAFPFDVSDTPGVGTAIGKNYEVSFYLSENRQGTLPLSKRKPLEPPYVGLLPTDYKIKSWDAPSTATYINIIGRQAPGSANQKAILVKHYLGGNSYDNYDINRAVHYTYTITINNLNDINIDTNVQTIDEPMLIEQGADLESLDSHASSRVFVLHTEDAFPAGTKITAELANFANSTDYPNWLKLSATSLLQSQIVVPGNNVQISRWQQPGSDWSYVRSKFIPHSSRRSADYTTATPPFAGFSLFGNTSSQPTLDQANHPDLVPGLSSYPAYDNELPYSWAHRRMCSKITDIPTATSQPTKLFLYADNYEVDGKDERSAVLRIIHEYNGTKTTKLYKIVQKAPIQFMGLPGENTIMLVENTEEYAHFLQNDMKVDLQMLAGLQWGNYPSVATSLSDGMLNTLQAVYQNVTSISNYSADSYLTKYGSMAGKWSIVLNGLIAEGAAKAPIEGGPFYSFYTGASNDYYNATYNSTAARYCHEKNWDENGNGRIDPAEVKWYLPSQQELQMFWTYREKLNINNDYYWSSTAVNDDQAYAVSMVEEIADPKYTYNGAQQKLSKISTPGKNRPRVRCVRRIAANAVGIKRYAPMIVYENKTLLVDCSNLTSQMHTTESKYGVLQSDPGQVQKKNSRVYKKLLVQLEQPSPVKYAPLHLDGGKCNESQGWRLPTQREMLLIWSVKDKIKAEANGNFEDFASGLYWTMTRGVSKQYVVDFATGISYFDDYSLISSPSLYYRCVKEVR